MKIKKLSAFTLLEIMIVVAIIGLLASIAIPNIYEAIATARAAASIVKTLMRPSCAGHWRITNR